MRMKFTISYKAEWGESLHADITFFARDGKRKVVDLAMPVLLNFPITYLHTF